MNNNKKKKTRQMIQIVLYVYTNDPKHEHSQIRCTTLIYWHQHLVLAPRDSDMMPKQNSEEIVV